MSTIVIYHAHCQDGWISAYIAAKVLDLPQSALRPASYDEYAHAVNQAALDAGLDGTVYILDFSLPPDVLMHLQRLVGTVVVLDHHETAQASLAEFVAPSDTVGAIDAWGTVIVWPDSLRTKYGLGAGRNVPIVFFDMDECGATMACKFFGVGNPPWLELAAYAKDRDLWQWKLQDSKAVSEYLFTLPHTIEAWDKVNLASDAVFDRVVLAGNVLLEAKAKRIAFAKSLATPCRLPAEPREMTVTDHGSYLLYECTNWYRGVVVNTPCDQSEVCNDLLADDPDLDFAAIYYIRPDGSVKVSIRSAKKLARPIAERFGGGGHANAAGCTFANYAKFVYEFSVGVK